MVIYLFKNCKCAFFNGLFNADDIIIINKWESLKDICTISSNTILTTFAKKNLPMDMGPFASSSYQFIFANTLYKQHFWYLVYVVTHYGDFETLNAKAATLFICFIRVTILSTNSLTKCPKMIYLDYTSKDQKGKKKAVTTRTSSNSFELSYVLKKCTVYSPT